MTDLDDDIFCQCGTHITPDVLVENTCSNGHCSIWRCPTCNKHWGSFGPAGCCDE